MVRRIDEDFLTERNLWDSVKDMELVVRRPNIPCRRRP